LVVLDSGVVGVLGLEQFKTEIERELYLMGFNSIEIEKLKVYPLWQIRLIRPLINLFPTPVILPEIIPLPLPEPKPKLYPIIDFSPIKGLNKHYP
jgi:hypothetical protein